MGIWGREIAATRKQLADAKTRTDSAALSKKIAYLDSQVRNYRDDLIRKNPGNILSVLLTL